MNDYRYEKTLRAASLHFFELSQHPRVAIQHFLDYLNIPGSRFNIFWIISTS